MTRPLPTRNYRILSVIMSLLLAAGGALLVLAGLFALVRPAWASQRIGSLQPSSTASLGSTGEIDPLTVCPNAPATITFNPLNPSIGQLTTFAGTVGAMGSGGGVILFSWSFGDGYTATGQTAKHAYNAQNIYTVIMTATGESGCVPLAIVTNTTITVGFGPTGRTIYYPFVLKNFTSAILPTSNNELVSVPSQIADLQGYTNPLDPNIRLEWSAPPDSLDGYRIYQRAQDATEPFHLLVTLPATLTTYSDDTPACGQSYYVTAFNVAGESGASAVSYYSPACPE